MHKKHERGQTPPERPIISGFLFEGIGMYVKYHIKGFLRIIEYINNWPKLPSNSLISTLDVHTLYTNIAHEEGLACTEEQLDKRIDKKKTY